MRKLCIALLMLSFLYYGQISYPTNGLLVHIPITYATAQNLVNNITPLISKTLFNTNHTGIANDALRFSSTGSVFTYITQVMNQTSKSRS
ncbi:hypothetical protein [Thermaurantimonas aggregans]|uniref:hypothetical protein n=1 Tax=Thermaurantimonas aggregans TaxID=2173829 RepID=UPI000F560EAF|nr:hypothetical protein [Thermaurantimonas aggregans]MCX8148063.1 hypothetical protein [Thermaurantimonas aggregans]